MHTTPYLFVYGTLMKGARNETSEMLRAGAAYVGEGSMKGLLYAVSWYPGAVCSGNEADRVWGEIYCLRAPEEMLEALDVYEDVVPDERESLYIRRIVEVSAVDGRKFPCWVYLYNRQPDGDRQIVSGRFKP